MLRLVDSPVVEGEAEAIADALQRGIRVALRCDAASERIVAGAVRSLGDRAVVAQVPAALDQVPRTVLELARATAPDAVVAIDAALRDPTGHTRAIDLLDRALRGQKVVVERVDRFAADYRDEVAAALQDSRRQLASWVLRRADLVSSPQPLSSWGGQERVFVSDEAPVALRNGALRPPYAQWQDYARDARAYELALQLEALEVVEDGAVTRTHDANSLRARLVDLLPQGVAGLLKNLAVHGRPLREDMLPRLPGFEAGAVERGAALGLWRSRAGAVLVDPEWTVWCARWMPRAVTVETHRVLAETFAREVLPDDPSAHRAGLLVLEAHRHLLLAGEVDRALQYARHGAALVVGYARDLSLERRFADAATLYERLLSTGAALPPRLRGYTRHYLHYNRAHARPELEPVIDTARGYEASLKDWPENAIFWSRTARSWFLAGEAARGRACLQNAMQAVPAHPDKAARLIARTAQRLAELGHPLDAIVVLDGYTPDTIRAEDDVARLAQRLEAGWDADRLEIPGATPLALHRRERFRVLKQAGGWRFLADRLGRSARCATPLDAAQDFVAKLADETRRLIRALDRELDDEERERKHLLLSMIDVIASGLDAPGAPTTWVYGVLERDPQGALWLVSGGNLAARYEVPDAVANSVVVGDHAWLAEVVAGPSGVPRGPVVRLETLPRRDRDAVWQAWRERLQA
jgi:hypothetical protein